MKKLMSITALLLAMLFIASSALPASAEEKTYKKGDIIEFGSYPQSQVTDKSLINELNKKQLQWNEYSDNIYDETEGKYVYTVIYSYCDTELNSEKYRGIKYSDRVLKINPSLSSDIIWFSYEPVEWVIIDPENGYVLCNNILDIQKFKHFENLEEEFNSAVPAAQWETSDIRAWLNDEFYNTAFSDTEKSKINTTTDNIVLFSLEDVLNPDFGFDTVKEVIFYYYYTSETLHRDYTDYSSSLDVDSTVLSRWLLRKTTGNLMRPAVVYKKEVPEFDLAVKNPITGEIEPKTGTFCAIDYFDTVRASRRYGIVPAMHINLETFDKPEPTAFMGDIDGDNAITASDARFALRASVKLEALTDEQMTLADVDKNNSVDAADARLILRASVKLEDPTKW